jgi:hypothetical protein
MKIKVILGLVSVFAANIAIAQTSEKEWLSMIETHSSNVEKILVKQCPSGKSMVSFKKGLADGTSILSSDAISSIKITTDELVKYGKEIAIKNGLEVENEDELIYLSAFPPNTDLNELISQNDVKNEEIKTNGPSIRPIKISSKEVLNCALAAIGADALYAFGGSSASWTLASMRTAFTNVARRFLGPIGVAIAVGSFGYCLYEANQD